VPGDVISSLSMKRNRLAKKILKLGLRNGYYFSVNRKVVNLSLTALGPVKPCWRCADVGVRNHCPDGIGNEWPADASFRFSGVLSITGLWSRMS
jgi:hypothetical protein